VEVGVADHTDEAGLVAEVVALAVEEVEDLLQDEEGLAEVEVQVLEEEDGQEEAVLKSVSNALPLNPFYLESVSYSSIAFAPSIRR
jgi:hypothetical protein